MNIYFLSFYFKYLFLQVIAKLVNQGKVDFFDFVLYVPLFLKIHERILQRPIT